MEWWSIGVMGRRIPRLRDSITPPPHAHFMKSDSTQPARLLGTLLFISALLASARAAELPPWRGQRVRLHVGAVDWQARVLVNGKAVGQHQGGYDRFSFDITDHLRWNGADEIVVAVTDATEGNQPRGKQSRKPEGIFYTATSG